MQNFRCFFHPRCLQGLLPDTKLRMINLIANSLEGLLKPEEITPENVWMIGDSAQDSDCALAANALPIRIGEPIWHDDNPKDGRIKYFHDFKAFYQALIAAGC